MQTTHIQSLLKLAGLACLSAAALTLPATSFAYDRTGPYISGYYGGYKARGGEFDDDNDLYEINAGYRFLPFIGVEFGYTDLGRFGGDVASVELDDYAASVVGFLPLTETFTLYGEVGQFFSKADVEFLDFENNYNNETLFYGAGVSFAVSDPLRINVEYQRYKLDVNDNSWPIDLDDEDTDVDALKLGVQFYF